ncbi:DNA helicase II [Planktothrix serta PCC 8927]|uniref:DNA helicase II n=1 Tax=Planktothrix serta PCC 8927 TaxID=671068 RepID=A0A7Z9BJ30_9CYAN|nr:nuclease-related domain-containing DEAD/DEAH box helicase [Planktothrix serta]VXD11225.1 DNA helicase II [Planktothrix serta PCC 8927]
MAIIIPSSIPAKASQGEKRLFDILAEKLPDNFYIRYEPAINNKRYPDFIILSPDFGLLVIEVKGWYPNNILEFNSDRFKIKSEQEDYTAEQNHKSPLRQARDYAILLLNNLQKYRILTQPAGDYQGKSAFPIGWGVLMSNITDEQANKIDLKSVLPFDQVAYRNELLDWEKTDFTGENLINRFRKMFAITFPFPALTPDQISTIKGIISPEFVIRTEPANINSVPPQFPLIPSDIILQTLDARQETLARSIGEGHRIFFGVAGSGKTLLLIARAKMLIKENPNAKILVVCFNVSLAAYLRSILHEDVNNPQYQKIQVNNFDRWAKFILGKLPAKVEGNRDEYTAKLVLDKLESYSSEQKWDAILIDEAHTFVPSWFSCCIKALKDSENGDLMIVADGGQNLYKRSDFKWKDVGIKAQGRTISKKFDLDKNYRNTQEVMTAAWWLLSEARDQHELLEDDEITFPTVQPSTVFRCGSRPQIHVASTPEKQIETVIKIVHELIKKGFSKTEIAIFYKQINQPYLSRLIHQLNQLGIETYWITENDKTKANYRQSQPGVRMITCLSSLGLEFKNVLILWLEQFDDCIKRTPDSLRKTKELYVAMTRTQENLFIFSSQQAKLLPKLKESHHFDVIISE